VPANDATAEIGRNDSVNVFRVEIFLVRQNIYQQFEMDCSGRHSLATSLRFEGN
jgi:hypothetical protein